LTRATFDAAGARVLTVGEDREAKVWDARTGKLVFNLVGHDGPLSDGWFSPDGMRIITASHDGTARWWDARTGSGIATLRGHAGRVRVSAFDPSGKRVATGGADGAIRLWNATTGEVMEVLRGHEGQVTTLVWTRDGTRLLSIADKGGAAFFWTVSTGEYRTLRHPDSRGFLRATVSPDGKLIATLDDDRGGVLLWDTQHWTHSAVMDDKEELKNVFSARFSPDSTRLALGFTGGKVMLWNTESKSKLSHPAPQPHNGIVLDIAFSADGSRFLSTDSDGGVVKVWDARGGALLGSLYGHAAGVQGAEFSPDGSRIVSAGRDGVAIVWDASKGNLRANPGASMKTYRATALSRDERLLAGGTDKGRVEIVEVATGKTIAEFQAFAGRVASVEFDSAASRIVTVGFDKTEEQLEKEPDAEHEKIVRVWPVTASGAPKETFSTKSSEPTAWFVPDDRHIAVFFENRVQIWDIANGKLRSDTGALGKDPGAVAYSPDGRRFVTGPSAKGLTLWDALTMKPLFSFGDAAFGLAPSFGLGHGFVFSPDGTRVYIKAERKYRGDAVFVVWDAIANKEVFKGKSIHHDEGPAGVLAISGDGNQFFTHGALGDGVIWNIRNGTARRLDRAHLGTSSAAFSPDGALLATGSWLIYQKSDGNWEESVDVAVKLWDARTGRLLAVIDAGRGTRRVAFSRDGRSLITDSMSGAVNSWDTTLESRPAREVAAILKARSPRRHE
jgi:WD40 repeat protein